LPKGRSAEVADVEPVMLSSGVVADAEAFEEVSDLAESLPLSEQALRASGSTAAVATVTAMRRMRVFMCFSCGLARPEPRS
jgi:hypothetical protein